MNNLRKILLNIPRCYTNFTLSKSLCTKVVEASNEAERTFVPPPFLKLPARITERKDQKYDYFLVLDFEATCDSPVTVVPQVFVNYFNRHGSVKQCRI